MEDNRKIPKGWRKVKLGEVCDSVSYGYTASAKKDPVGPKFLRITDIVPNRIDWETVPYCKISSSKLEKYLLKEGDIVVARTGATTGYNKIIRKGIKSVFASYLIRFRINNKEADSMFVSYNLRSYKWNGFVENIIGGSAQPGVNAKQFASFEFLLPPLPEQKAIASVLSSLDDKIELLHRQNKTLESMAEALFRKWFIEDAKEDWEEKPISILLEVLSGFAFKSTSYTEHGKYRLITIRNVQDGYLDLSKVSYIENLPAKMPDYCILDEGDILISLTGHVGRCSLVSGENLLLNQRVAKLKPKKVRDRAFVYVLFRQSKIKSLLEEMAKGTAQPNLSPIEMANIKIKIPPTNILMNFSEIVSPIIDKILSNKRQIRTLEKLRDTLLPKLMSGKIRVKF